MELNKPQSGFTTLFSFLKEVIVWRIHHLDSDFNSKAPKLKTGALESNWFSSYINQHQFSQEEIIVILLALTPNMNPDFLLNVIGEEFPNGIDLPLFGGVKGQQHRGILPTGETVQFILGGTNPEKRIACVSLFSEDALLEKTTTAFLDKAPKSEPFMSGKLLLHPEAFYLITTGKIPAPKMSPQFPAKKLETDLEWEDLILNKKTETEIKDLEIWLQHSDTFLNDWAMRKRVKPGFRVLFHGPPGTGKTLTASLLGKYTNKDVYRIDLSTVVSKYIGETEKNLSDLFNKAANKNWILFFDEADAIFGKRTNVRDAHDKYANQEVSYLLQRIESHSGLVILATNFKDNIDEAFMRRFQSICEFQLPSPQERYLIWKTNLPKQLNLDPKIDLADIAEKYEVTGSNIINIIQYCSIKVLSLNSNTLNYELLIEGVKKEYTKENRLF